MEATRDTSAGLEGSGKVSPGREIDVSNTNKDDPRTLFRRLPNYL